MKPIRLKNLNYSPVEKDSIGEIIAKSIVTAIIISLIIIILI